MSGGARFVAPPLVSNRAKGTPTSRRRGTLAHAQRAFLAYIFILPAVALLAFVGLGNFAAMAEDATMRAATVNVLRLTAFAVVVSVTVPLFVARLILGLPSGWAQYLFRVLFVIPLVLPQVWRTRGLPSAT